MEYRHLRSLLASGRITTPPAIPLELFDRQPSGKEAVMSMLADAMRRKVGNINTALCRSKPHDLTFDGDPAGDLLAGLATAEGSRMAATRSKSFHHRLQRPATGRPPPPRPGKGVTELHAETARQMAVARDVLLWLREINAERDATRSASVCAPT